MYKKKEIEIPNYVNLAIEYLENSGFEAWIVGGFVRDYINESTNNYNAQDIDIATNALPEQVISIFNNTKFNVYELGKKFGTIGLTIYNDKDMSQKTIEITTYRCENDYLDGRHPNKVSFTKTLDEDLKRRDFTINAIAYNPKHGIYDPFYGVEDIKNKTIKTINNAKERFNEDNLRILRALRFASTLGFEIEKDTSKTIFQLKHKINNVSIERIESELTKLLCGINAKYILDKYRNIIFELIPELTPLNNFNQKTKYHSYDAYTHTLITLDKMPISLDEWKINDNQKKELIAIGKWAALFHDIGKPEVFTIDSTGQGHFYGHPEVSEEISSKIFKRLRFSNKIEKNALLLIKWHDHPMKDTKKSVKRFLNKFYSNNITEENKYLFKIYCALRRADSYAHAKNFQENLTLTNKIEEIFDQIIAENEAFSLKDLKIKGNDIINLGIKPGPSIGTLLDKCMDAVINEQVNNNKLELIKYIKTIS